MRNTYGVTVIVNGKPWQRVPNLTDAGLRARAALAIPVRLTAQEKKEGKSEHHPPPAHE